MPNVASRPIGVTVVAVLTWISGALDVLGGTLLLFQTHIGSVVQQFGGAGQLVVAALVSIAIGAVVVVVALGLMRGSSGARTVITVVEVLSIAHSVFLAIANPAGAVGEYVGIALALIVIALLWTRRASAFFHR